MTALCLALAALVMSLPALVVACTGSSPAATPTPPPVETSRPEPSATPTQAPTETPPPETPTETPPAAAPQAQAPQPQPTDVPVEPPPTAVPTEAAPAANVVIISNGLRYANTNPQSGTVYECAPGVSLDGAREVPYAFRGTATNVTIRNCIIENYASPSQRAAIDMTDGASNWVIENNEVRYNADTGIYANSGAIVRNNFIHHNGRNGLKANGVGVRVEGNEIAYNNSYCPIRGSANAEGCNNPNFEAGGTKFVRTTGLVVVGNHVHDNCGPGLWTDISNYQTTYSNNTVENNSRAGIFHEISYDARIVGNTVRNNGSTIQVETPVGVRSCSTHPRSLGQIQIDFSSGVNGGIIEVTGNTLEKRPGEDGIYVIGGFRSSTSAIFPPTGGFETHNVWVHGNSGSGACIQTEGPLDATVRLEQTRC
jgi:parallel beta-helix repeat protein